MRCTPVGTTPTISFTRGDAVGLATACYGHNIDIPTIVGGALAGKRVVSVAAGRRHGAAVTSDGKVYTWGEYIYDNPLVQGTLAGHDRVLSVSAGKDLTTAVTDEGKVLTWDCGKCGAPGSEGFGDIDNLLDNRTRASRRSSLRDSMLFILRHVVS